jgi:exopolyphosphatase/guanosine-5'-triphosphate,3'-diphosphate pyrophosphatase
MRVAVVDVGSNSTRLLVAEVDARAGAVEELVRRSTVTRLGEGVDASGSLSEHAVARVLETLAGYRREIDEQAPDASTAVLTSAVRDAANGAAFARGLSEQFGLDARVLSGEQEAQLTYLGAMSGRADSAGPTVVIDIGGGSTEFTIGVGERPRFHVSLPAGVVRMSERHIHSDPPGRAELENLARDSRETFAAGIPARQRAQVRYALAVGGTATSGAAIDQRLDPYDPTRVHGYRLSRSAAEMLLSRLAAMSERERRAMSGLHPDRAPTIVAGMILLLEALGVFGLADVEVSEHDILHGAALRLAAGG